ncbi:glucose dehydrogenase [Bacillus sp. HMF5848]|uniref:PQQ-dependent sugar dehydrogenase n=1 Tax=Bacillus sp. HMF5848 TaxID=2495421 RepID=UPI000F7B459D|nr:PQQ-dependent sugar dehydrogenase [Bacillus sp. HMF5848]RSK25700.1 glucose dehydrogenase [Bacillus sp. HMF5848]
MKKVKVRLRPIVTNVNLPTVMKTAVLPGDTIESLFIVTQVGEIFRIRNGELSTFLDIRSKIIELGKERGGYDERGLLGLAFHPQFYYNGLFYLHYSVAGTQGPGTAVSDSFKPDPCDTSTLNLSWENRETQYDHINTVEEWVLRSSGQPVRRRALLNVKRPFFNHNGFNSLNFSPETGKLVFTTGDGGSGYDPFNLSQDNFEIAGKIIEIDVAMSTVMNDPPTVTRFDELPSPILDTITVIAKGVRNLPGISFQRYYNQYIKHVGNVGQDLAESIFSFIYYKPIPAKQLIQARLAESPDLINLGWRGWEGAFPTSIIRNCSENATLDEKVIAYYDEAVADSVSRISPLTTYFHKDPRPNKFEGNALTGVQPYMGNEITDLTGSVVFTDIARNTDSQAPTRGVLAYTKVRLDGKLSDYQVIEIDYDFGSQPAYFVGLGTNLAQTRLYLGAYESMRVTDYNKGTIFEVVGASASQG